jgi:Na+/H+ antiporter NhaD/arsenite permease-like protein
MINRWTAGSAGELASPAAVRAAASAVIANLIVVEKAARRGIVIGFWDYFRVGAPLTLLTLAVGIVWLMWA